MVTINSIEVENLRGYEYTRLQLRRLTILVGENNEGKSSLLKMLDRLMQIPASFWDGHLVLTEEDIDFWYPANDTKHQARRFTINVTFTDGRTARRFDSTRDFILPLRFAIYSNGLCRLNIGPPKRNELHDTRAVELLRLLQHQVQLILLPPVRDANSSTFANKVTQNVKQELEKTMRHNQQGGAPKEYRLAKDIIKKIEEIVALHSGALARSDDSPLASMLKSSEVRVELFPKDIYELIKRSMYVYLSTGKHDSLKVLPSEVGNGLQSLIDINLTFESILGSNENKKVIVVIEEPEAFLHPSAQRLFMEYLRRALVDKVQSAILTTHSPIMVDEANYEEIVLVRNQKHFEPNDEPADRASINTSLMTTSSAEMFFARTIVLIEGDGDKAFFNTLLRRIKRLATVDLELAGLIFQVTGGCTFYAPWLKLIRSYGRPGDDPFDYMWLMDGDAAVNSGERPVLRAIRDGGFSLTPETTNEIVMFGDLLWDTASRTKNCNSSANRALFKYHGHLFCCDLEWALFNGSSDVAVSAIKRALSTAGISTEGNHVELARRLGSKIGTGSGSDGSKKQPFIRALIAENLELSSLPSEIYAALRAILQRCYKYNNRKVTDLFTKCGIAEG
jgi:predicted ATP-dependent endonuclease of OLD family